MPDQDRRKHPRIPVHIDITYDNDVVLTQANVKDLSLGGANILTALPLPVGTQLSIWFRSTEPGFELKARVLRVTEEDPDDEVAQPGMGIQFYGISSKEENAIQELIEWYLTQPTQEATPPEAPEELPKSEEASEQRYIETQLLPAIEAAPEVAPDATVQIRLPIEVNHAEPSVDLEATQLEANTTDEFETPSPFENPTSSDDAIQTIRISPEELEAQRTARVQAPSFETIRIHPEDLNALQSAAQEASSTVQHEHSSDTTTLPEMPAFVPESESGENPADAGERKAKKKRKR